jgi:hypothetical protein
MLAHAPRGLTEQFLLARGFSVETLSSLVLATLAIVVTISQYSRQVLLDFAAAAGGRYLALTSSGSGGWVSPRPMVEAKFACLAEYASVPCRAINRWRPATDVDRHSQLHHLPTSYRWLAQFERRDNYARDAASQ